MGGITTTLFQRPRDPKFNNTTLLLSGNFPTNGAQNNTFLDSSSNGFTITRNPSTGPNAPTQGTFSPFSQTGWSNFFSGSTSSLRMAANTAFDQNAGSFSVECWVYPAVIQATTGLYIYGAQGNTGMLMVAYGYSTGLFKIDQGGGGGGIRITSNSTYPANTWHHVAYTYDGTTLRLFINGVLQGTATGITPIASQAVAIGEFGGSSYFNGYVSNFRICRAAIPTDYQTSSTTVGATIFTPSTSPLTTTSQGASNVTFLTCQSNRFVDNGSAGISFTINGTPSVQPFSPFAPSGAYTTTAVGGSGYFDGTGDYLSFTGSIAISGQFSAECWFYRTATGAAQQTLFAFNSNNTSYASIRIDTDGNGNNDRNITLNISTNGTSWNTFAVNSIYWKLGWNHVVATRDGSNNVRLFLNGVLINTVSAVAGALFSTSTTHSIGCNTLPGTATNLFTGYISNVRLVNGSIPTAYQTSSTTTNAVIFTPPSAPLTTTSQGATESNVTLLTNFTNAGIFDSTAKNVLETVGNAQISTTQWRFGGSSMSFDGTGDYLIIPKRPYFDFSGDFTIEFWLYVNSLASYSFLMDTRSSVSTFWLIDLTTGGVIGWGPDATIRISSSAITTGQWYHVAISRSGSSTRMFLNGTQTGSTYTSSASITAGTTSLVIAGSALNLGTSNANVYMDDIRITPGVARYTGNFNVPTIGFTDR